MPQVQRDLAHDLGKVGEVEAGQGKPTSRISCPARPGKQHRTGAQDRGARRERRDAEVEQRLGDLGAQEIGLAKNTGEDDKPFNSPKYPGLKVVVATLATSDPAPGSPPPARRPPSRGRPRAPPLRARLAHLHVHSCCAGG